MEFDWIYKRRQLQKPTMKSSTKDTLTFAKTEDQKQS